MAQTDDRPKGETMQDVRFIDGQRAFAIAIEAGELTAEPGPHFAGDRMYVGTWRQPDGSWAHTFKHIVTREYDAWVEALPEDFDWEIDFSRHMHANSCN